MARRDDDPHEVPRADVHLTDLPRAAGGFGALWSTLTVLHRDSGLVRGARGLLAMNQPAGFDCPGCAWPEAPAAHRGAIEFCENGAKALAEEATTARATPALFAKASVDELCQLSDFELGQLGRITEPLVLEGRHYRAIGWDAALAMIAAGLREAGPDATALYTSGPTTSPTARTCATSRVASR